VALIDGRRFELDHLDLRISAIAVFLNGSFG
jgi:hypothetical protein